MDATDRLNALVTTLQRRWGRPALQKLSALPPPPAALESGLPALDAALPQRGLPRGALTELVGRPTCGMTTLALRLAARAQAQGEIVALLDLAHSFDPPYAARCGVALDRLLLVRPRDPQEGLEITRELVTGATCGLLLFSSTREVLAAPGGRSLLERGLRLLAVPLSASPTALLCLSPQWPGGGETPSVGGHARLRLAVRGQHWQQQGADIVGFRALVTVQAPTPGGPPVELEVAL